MHRDGIELLWPGKYDATGERSAIPSPGQRIEAVARYGPSPEQGTLVGGDNLAVMDALLRGGEPGIDLVVVDPPFATGEKFSVVTPIGEGREVVRAPAYSDRWRGGIAGFLAMLDPRLRLIHRLLADHGSLYVHLDPTVVHPVKVLLDEIFGAECFQREIVWRIGWVSGFKSRARNWIRNHDTILFYVKDPQRFTFNKRYIPYPPGYLRRDGKPPTGAGIPIDDVWNAGPGDLELRGGDSLDSIQIKSFSREKTGWATQKNESLLRRIIEASSNPGDRVADFFCGSGSTLAAAASLGRRWFGCDRASTAVHLARKRLREMDASFVLAGLRAGVPARSGGAEVDGAEASVAPAVQGRGREAGGSLAAGLEYDGDGAWLRVDPARRIALEELRAVEAVAAQHGARRLRIVARHWEFSLAEIAARPGPKIELSCLHWRGPEPPLPRPELDLEVRSVAPWTLACELRGYRPSAPTLLPEPELAERVAAWQEWIDAWALGVDPSPLRGSDASRAGGEGGAGEGGAGEGGAGEGGAGESGAGEGEAGAGESGAGAGESGAGEGESGEGGDGAGEGGAGKDGAGESGAGEGEHGAGPRAPLQLFQPVLEHFRTRRRRALVCAAEPFVLPEDRRLARVEVRLQIVDIVGLETIWPCVLDFDGSGELVRWRIGPERAGDLLDAAASS